MRVPRTEIVKNPRKYGNAKEREVAKRGGYRLTANSGAGGEKGDLVRGDWTVEHKATEADSYRVTADLIAKLRNDGLTSGKPGCLIVTLGNGERLAIMELRHFESLTSADQVQDDPPA